MRAKLFVTVTMMLCVAVLFMACSPSTPITKQNLSDQALNAETPDPTVAPVDDNELESPEDNNDHADTPVDAEGETPNVTIETYSEYLSYLATTDLPDEFVVYQAISQFGAFKQFICLSDSRWGDYSHYMYTLVDETGTEMMLYVECGRQSLTTTQLPLITSVNLQDMRCLSTAEKGRYLYDGVEYTYLSGKLYSVSWTDGTRGFTLACDTMFSDYPQNANTAIELLMNVSNATEVVASVSEALNKA